MHIRLGEFTKIKELEQAVRNEKEKQVLFVSPLQGQRDPEDNIRGNSDYRGETGLFLRHCLRTKVTQGSQEYGGQAGSVHPVVWITI